MNLWQTILASVNDDTFRSHLRQCRNLVKLASETRWSGSEHARLMLTAGNLRRFTLSNIGVRPEHRSPEVTQYGLVQ